MKVYGWLLVFVLMAGGLQMLGSVVTDETGEQPYLAVLVLLAGAVVTATLWLVVSSVFRRRD